MVKRVIKLIIALSIIFLPLTKNVWAIEDPLASPNNIFGIHILNETDLEEAALLVNSSGGDWGYVTLVVRKDERDTKRWQNVFDIMRRLHLIPIVRIATRQLNGGWEKPNFDEIDGWVSFLNSLNWVVKNRYVVIGNEPNHAKEWGGKVDPVEYAKYLEAVSHKLKAVSSDFFILPAALDASAPEANGFMSEISFLKVMLAANPDIFNFIDGLNSHSYPNPDFSGSPEEVGRGTVATFRWEIEVLHEMGVTKKLPVFITETGWKNKKDNEKEISDNLINAFTDVWKDEDVVAVTPFVLDYEDPPFDIFSWTKKDGSFRLFYFDIKNLPKKKGKPEILSAGRFKKVIFPPILKIDNKFYGIAYLENIGQSIWQKMETTEIKRKDKLITVTPLFFDLEPFEKGLVIFEK